MDNSSVTVGLPYVLIELPLAATRAKQGLLKKRSWHDGERTLTSVPVSTKKQQLDKQSYIKNKLELPPTAAATNNNWPRRFPKIDRLEHGAKPCYHNFYNSNIVLPCRNLSKPQNLIRGLLFKEPR